MDVNFENLLKNFEFSMPARAPVPKEGPADWEKSNNGAPLPVTLLKNKDVGNSSALYNVKNIKEIKDKDGRVIAAYVNTGLSIFLAVDKPGTRVEVTNEGVIVDGSEPIKLGDPNSVNILAHQSGCKIDCSKYTGKETCKVSCSKGDSTILLGKDTKNIKLRIGAQRAYKIISHPAALTQKPEAHGIGEFGSPDEVSIADNKTGNKIIVSTYIPEGEKVKPITLTFAVEPDSDKAATKTLVDEKQLAAVAKAKNDAEIRGEDKLSEAAGAPLLQTLKDLVADYAKKQAPASKGKTPDM